MTQEIILIGGYPASGKSTYTKSLFPGYSRLNRDEEGGSIADLLPKLEVLINSGKSVVIDNLFGTQASRAIFVEKAKKHLIPIRFMEMSTTLEEAQFNACLRMIEKCGKVLHPEDHKKHKDPNLFPVAVLYKYRKEYQKPKLEEGFLDVKTIKFERTFPKSWINKALILDADGTLRETTNGQNFPTDPSHVRILPNRREKILQYKKDGYLIFGISNQSGIAKGDLTKEKAEECFAETNRQLGIQIPWSYCPHKVPPISCWCRKPGTGLMVELIVEHNLDPKQIIYVGDMTSDKTFAARCGVKFVDQKEFFK